MMAAELAARLGARRCGAGWIARCPAHNDRVPSLSIGEGRDGRTLIHCFAKCATETVLAALGLRAHDLFAERGPRAPRLTAPVPRATARQVAQLRARLTPRERVMPVTIIRAKPSYLNAAIARGLALAVEGELVQIVLRGST
jgi:hypothetical protein